MQRKKLPIGIQTFSEIREEGYYYVDKTPFALQLIEQGKHYFLSRPRRFGKSLFLDTLKELFEGNQQLFTALYAEQRWDWSIQYPVIRLSLGGGLIQTKDELQHLLSQQLDELETRFHTQTRYPEAGRRLQNLIQSAHKSTGQRVVVLVDEYDKPIIDNLTQPDIAREMRDELRSLYSVLKDNDAHLKFVFITGVSKFSKVSLFSGLNNLTDLTIDENYSAICGYTEQDLGSVFEAELEGLDRDRVRQWYNGYNWLGESVYNPYDLLLFLRERKFRSFWFETATPTFLVEYLAQNKWFTPDLLELEVNDAILSTFDVDRIAPEALLWQTGYLTFHKVEEISTAQWIYTLGYPNREVEAALNDALLPVYGADHRSAIMNRSRLLKSLQKQDMSALQQSIHALFASIPNDWYRKNTLADFEGHYASVFYSQLAALGLNVRAEDITNKGRIDLSLRLEQQVYLFEFKVVEDQATGTAIQQLIAKDYADKFKEPDIQITLVGIEFSKAERNVVGFETLVLDRD